MAAGVKDEVHELSRFVRRSGALRAATNHSHLEVLIFTKKNERGHAR
jgi:hypothetical protein